MPGRRPRRVRAGRWRRPRVAEVFVDDAGPDVGHLGPLGELVDDEGVELLVVGHRHVEQEVLAAGDDEYTDGVREPGRPVAEGLDVAPRRRPDPDGDQRLDRAADGGEVDVEQGAADVWHPGLPWAGCSILTAGSAQLTAIRQQAIDRQLLAADMPATAQATRVYDDYLRELAKTHPDDLAVLAVSLIGPRNQVGKLVRHLELLP
jgi:Protein of unknown function (DUF2000)